MSKFNLPKHHLSYSAIDMWLKYPEKYREKYYKGIEQYVTPELSFGKKIADLLEVGDESVKHVRRYPVAEKMFDLVIDEVPVFGFMDSFDPDTCSILEFKTGKTPWTQKRVDEHLQLDLYSLAVECMYNRVDDHTMLVWMETERVDRPSGGRISHSDAYGIRLTGKVTEFHREITKHDRLAMRRLLRSVAEDISEDYTSYQSRTARSGGRIR